MLTFSAVALKQVSMIPHPVTLYHNDPNFSDRQSGQTVQSQIRLLLEEQFDQGLHCLLLHLRLFDKIPEGFASLLEY